MALALSVAGGGAMYLHLEKRVTLVVDGRGSLVRTFGATVGELLEGQGIPVGPHDEVIPPPDAELSDGMEVRLLVAKEITLVLNGKRRTIWVTGGKTVEEVLEQINIRAGRHAYVRPSRGARVEDGDVIVYRAAIAVRVTADGETDEVITNAPDVGSLLDSLGLLLRGKDRVRPSKKTSLEPGMEITVTRVRIRRVVEEAAVPFETRVRRSDELYEGEERVEREGSEGMVRRVFRVRTEDGREVDRTLLSTNVVREPVHRVVVEGTKPRNVEPAKPGNVQEGVASWYHRDGLVAAHKTLPFGTSVTVTNVANGRSVTVVINDRGPYVDGRIIDLSDDAFARISSLSRGTARVRISW